MKFSRKDFLKQLGATHMFIGQRVDLKAHAAEDASVEGKRYREQISAMADKVRQWRQQNRDREALVSFPHKLQMVAIPISRAVKTGAVSGNDAGIEMLRYLWDWDDRYEPTVEMVRMALEEANLTDRPAGVKPEP